MHKKGDDTITERVWEKTELPGGYRLVRVKSMAS